ncbi:type II toxin-antitoxin system MqsR family toxin [Desulfovibrio psychrotolerans]|uniref:Type II toxin-antitoxin system MqsR family toxin n=1 Tax=Desulfovibrio psychrotolerans TaxID=415242 RepID=A0A7J0BX64_9BACT|nr:type II toxin-antitoxin system MqsR family toxin [Desulfovibrio psychrotolerans]GFM38288.1 hypothetical protein DSM19430T_29720 [Desulfovibrio psychrotolerans]
MSVYDLETVKDIVRNGPKGVIFSTKEKTTFACKRLGISKLEMFEILLELEPKHFFKSMADKYIEGDSLDVYHYDHENIPLYIKFKIKTINGENLIVTSMHKR